MIFNIGPFTLYRCDDNNHLDITLTVFSEAPFGWEYGDAEGLEGSDALVFIRVFGLNVLRIEFWRWGFDLRLLGFWWII